jgi:outer membrane protein assembly factor BamB
MNTIAIIPSLSALGPLGLLALIAPAAFAALMLWMKRWKAALGAASVLSTVYLTQGWWQPWLRPTWWSTRAGFWMVLGLVAAAFCFWSKARRHCGIPITHANNSRTDDLTLWFLIATATIVFTIVAANGAASGSLGITALIVLASAGAGKMALKLAQPAESVLVTTLCLGCVAASLYETAKSFVSPGFQVAWVFEPERSGAFFSPPCVTTDLIYIAAAHRDGFQQSGEVYAVERSSGRAIWSWNNDGALRPVFGSPSLVAGRLFVGEGLHSDSNCKLFCLDASTGKKVWEIKTAGHVESSPVVRDGMVYFGAGDDGLYCVSSDLGKLVWHYQSLHIDATPLVHEGVVYVGSYRAEDNLHHDLRLIALDAKTGTLIWNEQTDLSCYSCPTIEKDRVIFSLGTGDVESSGPSPAGAVVAIDKETGRQMWRTNLPDSVLGSPLIVQNDVFVGCRDGRLVSLSILDGKFRWQTELGTPVLAAPASEWYGHSGGTVAVTSSGRCVKFSPSQGRVLNEIELVRAVHGNSGLFIATPIVIEMFWNRNVYISGAIVRGIRETPCLICLTDG